ncbi:hypothetical protein [Shimia abyssi]|uniref:Uncharacterized protein n=1 Tax=Shimia abyssi TaxID=1662395 RepID=A0A2P8FI09_9RHOB|nr:hypothetical protein [Shimia abyssi]PSL21362.1 hypothetical protein CLV88_102482 [Shimia abyssi]
MGWANAKLDAYPRAISVLDTAKRLSRSFATINLIERLESLKVRAATHDWYRSEHGFRAANEAGRVCAKQAFNDKRKVQRETAYSALKCLKMLDELAGTSEESALTERRELLRVTVSKRLVMTARDARLRTSGLNEMVCFMSDQRIWARALPETASTL